jgi:hypothetical protein
MKDVLAPVSACHDVVIGPGRLDSNAARHGSFSIRERHLSSSCTLTPFSRYESATLSYGRGGSGSSKTVVGNGRSRELCDAQELAR